MSTTPGRPRVSGIPASGKSSGIPTPGRFRSPSTVHSQLVLDPDAEYASRAFADAIKANDPAQHRTGPTHDTSASSTSPKLSSATLHSGRRSVAGRPSSSSNLPNCRPITPTARPPSRQSDTYMRSASRAGRTFEVGDNVRIESLGYEGTLRYLGEINGKAGSWAGVELSGGFSGKGKNDGSVNGTQYFVCPPRCGVFVAAMKLSAPTVGANHRPPSVASSRSGRVTPSSSFSLNSGRITPSSSSGRTVPLSNVSRSSGRITPGATPTARKAKPLATLGNHQSKSPGLENQITSGSRASKYIGMTAHQLNSRSEALRAPSSPSQPAYLDYSRRSSDSPFTTPKAGAPPRSTNSSWAPPPGTKSRPSLHTPRHRIPSAVAMPPPPSPSPSRSTSINSTYTLNDSTIHDDQIVRGSRPSSSLDLAAASYSLQNKINDLLSGSTIASDSNEFPPLGAASGLMSAMEVGTGELAAGDLNQLRHENTSLRGTVTSLRAEVEQFHAIQNERDAALSSVAEMEKELHALRRKLSEKDMKLESLEHLNSKAATDLELTKTETEARVHDCLVKLDNSEALVKNLMEAIEVKEGAEHENTAFLKAKIAEISLLETRLANTSAEWDTERKDLGAQIDELRQAGQETIALYEERLSAAESRRYEMEDRVIALEEQVKKAAVPPLSNLASQRTPSAIEIDNETLREQVQHLQKQLSAMEDTLEDVRAASEREEAIMRERIKRLKEKEDSIRNELDEGRKTVEQVAKAEALAKSRVEEVEEALRESTLALENARAEIEVLRTDAAAVDAGVHGTNDMSLKFADMPREAATERARLMEEIQELREELDRSGAAIKSGVSYAKVPGERLKLGDHSEELMALRKALEERSAELESLRKRLNRDIPLNISMEPKSSPSKHESEEMKGLKHIVQELQKEILVVTQRNKVLESENRLLISETDQLREELKILEDNVKHKQEAELGLKVDSSTLLPDTRAKYEADLEQLRKRVAEAEMKAVRVTHDLNKEISELEALVESKIYREDELEQEVELLKEKLSQNKQWSKNGVESVGVMPWKLSRASTVGSSNDDLRSAPQEAVCEICEQQGHDIFTCDLLKDSVSGPPSRVSLHVGQSGTSELFCVDCESYGHAASECPHSLDVF
ncbi:hypothetical protein F5I97DRAFT_1855623 [Phlebopus sp. FC_14]|nr:hypothetical protein F5I97DRAFT_1855623 [Phlebopus sp. FC_14]